MSGLVSCKTLVPGLPIFAADLVAFNGRVSLCIADVAPSTLDLSLPPAYLAAAAALRYARQKMGSKHHRVAFNSRYEGLQRVSSTWRAMGLVDIARRHVMGLHLTQEARVQNACRRRGGQYLRVPALREQMLEQCPEIVPRPLPEWGQAILSPQACVCVGPPKEDAAQEQAAAFVGYARGLHGAHLRLAAAAAAAAADDPWGSGGSGGSGGTGAEERRAAQVRFCEKQLENDKTRRVLERSMGEALTMRYMTEVGPGNYCPPAPSSTRTLNTRFFS